MSDDLASVQADMDIAERLTLWSAYYFSEIEFRDALERARNFLVDNKTALLSKGRSNSTMQLHPCLRNLDFLYPETINIKSNIDREPLYSVKLQILEMVTQQPSRSSQALHLEIASVIARLPTGLLAEYINLDKRYYSDKAKYQIICGPGGLHDTLNTAVQILNEVSTKTFSNVSDILGVGKDRQFSYSLPLDDRSLTANDRLGNPDDEFYASWSQLVDCLIQRDSAFAELKQTSSDLIDLVREANRPLACIQNSDGTLECGHWRFRDDFRIAEYKNHVVFTFTEKQSKLISFLIFRRNRRATQQEIHLELYHDKEIVRLRDNLFKSRSQIHPAWGTLIKSIGHDWTLDLNFKPDEPVPPQ